ncbi:flippase [Novosphingobium aquiterrae]|uniref:Flippase n=1 Tax=Novosphingobium aquiterrae TaxID=624388 RepID=A0ABV6PGJ3_9SPHN
MSTDPPGASPRVLLDTLIARSRGKGLRAIAGNTGWLLGEKVWRALLAALVTAWVARYLGPTNYASIAYALAIVTFFGPVAQLGISNLIVRDLAREPGAAGEIIGTGVVLRMGAGLLGLVGAIAFLFATDPTATGRLVGALIAGQLVFQSAEVIDCWFQSRLESRYGVRLRLVVSLVMSALKVGLILAKMPLWTFALAISLEFGLTAAAIAAAYLWHGQSVGWRFSAHRARGLLHEGLPFMASALAIAIYMRFDQVLLRQIDGVEALGIFAAIVPLAQVWQIVPVSIVASLTPVIAREAEKGPEAYAQALRAMFLLLGALSLAIALLIAVAAGPAVNLLLGQAYAGAVPALRVYGFTNIPVALGLAWNVWATISGKGKLLLINTVAGSVVSLIANLALIPRYGVMGAAVAANLSYFTSALLINYVTCRDMFFLQLGIVRKVRVAE